MQDQGRAAQSGIEPSGGEGEQGEYEDEERAPEAFHRVRLAPGQVYNLEHSLDFL